MKSWKERGKSVYNSVRRRCLTVTQVKLINNFSMLISKLLFFILVIMGFAFLFCNWYVFDFSFFTLTALQSNFLNVIIVFSEIIIYVKSFVTGTSRYSNEDVQRSNFSPSNKKKKKTLRRIRKSTWNPNNQNQGFMGFSGSLNS